jgi:RNA polymerase sigma-70 factor (ECF subfamily)
VLLAGAADSPESAKALETLCRNYWRPIYAYARRRGHSQHDAEDLTQSFFARLLARNDLAHVAPGKGKFRSFLLAALKHFMANEWDKARAQKRGGGGFISIEAGAEEGLWQIESAEAQPDHVFDQRWAITVLDRTLLQLRLEHIQDGKVALFDHLKETLAGDRKTTPYAVLARVLNTTEGAVKVAVHRLRRRYRELLRAEIAETVGARDEVEEELRHLFAALAR